MDIELQKKIFQSTFNHLLVISDRPRVKLIELIDYTDILKIGTKYIQKSLLSYFKTYQYDNPEKNADLTYVLVFLFLSNYKSNNGMKYH